MKNTTTAAAKVTHFGLPTDKTMTKWTTACRLYGTAEDLKAPKGSPMCPDCAEFTANCHGERITALRKEREAVHITYA